MPLDRLTLIKTLSDLPTAQFEQVLFAINPPNGIVPSAAAPQGDRAAKLLDWADNAGGPGIHKIQNILSDLQGIQPLPPEAVCPYKGLEYFDCNDEDYKYFYGREALTQTLLDKVAQSNFLAIVGASGSGKSSVLRAGLLQRLKDKGGYEIRILVPGEHPLENLALAFVDESSDRIARATQHHQQAKQLIQTGAEGLASLVQTSEAKQVVLVVDQFEEAFTLCQTTERQAFFATLLGGLAATPSQMRLILSMRSDFVGKCFEQDYSGLAEKVQRVEAVLPMSTDELTRAITEPARQAGLTLEPGLVETLMADVESSPGRLPLLQYTLTELWKQQEEHQLKLSTYAQIGGVIGALNQRADLVYGSLTPEQQQTAQHIFLNLTQLGEGTQDTRRRVFLSNLISEPQHPAERVKQVIAILANQDNRLLVTSEVVSKESERRAIVDVAHEALIRHWRLLRQWIEANRYLLQQQRRIEASAVTWQEHQQVKGYLLQGFPLKEALQFQKQQAEKFPLSDSAQLYIKKSVWQRRWSGLKMASGLLLLLLLLLPVVDYSLHIQKIEQYYTKLNGGSQQEERESAFFLVQDCLERRSAKTGYLAERFTGQYCRSLSTEQFSRNANLRYANLSYADLSDANLRDANLRDANLSFANLSYANLSDANLGFADLGFADLSYAYLSGADLRRANLSYADLSHAYLGDADLRDAYPGYAYLSDANLRDTDLRDADLSYANLGRADLSGANLRRANLRRADLSYANLGLAYLGYVDPGDAGLRDTDLSDADLSDANLSYANLSYANLRDTDLRDADLSFADLSFADLSGADLSGADLRATDLRDIRSLRSAHLTGENPPYLCKVALPAQITDIDPNRDCGQLEQVLIEDYGLSQTEADQWVEELRNPAEVNP